MSKFNFAKVFKNLDKNVLLTSIAVLAVIIVGILILFDGSFSQFLNKIKVFEGVSKDEIAQKTIDYINNNILSGQTASLVNSSEESGVVKIRISISGQEFDSYISKDGKLLFPEAIAMEEGGEALETTAETVKTCDDLVKKDKAELEAYVVSMCPYGTQMQRVLADVVNSAPSLSENIKVRYMGAVSNNIITSMHGDVEAQENLKQICIRDEQANKYWKYVSCYIKAGDTAECLTSTGIDKNKLNECLSDSSRGLTYAQNDFDLNAVYNIQGSPTLVLNGEMVSEFDFGGRTSEAIKSLICCGSTTQASVCSQTLNTATAASSFSETYEGTGGSASCE